MASLTAALAAVDGVVGVAVLDRKGRVLHCCGCCDMPATGAVVSHRDGDASVDFGPHRYIIHSSFGGMSFGISTAHRGLGLARTSFGGIGVVYRSGLPALHRTALRNRACTAHTLQSDRVSARACAWICISLRRHPRIRTPAISRELAALQQLHGML
jgi:hypothetical protein